MIRKTYYHKKICLCRKCNGTGRVLSYDTDVLCLEPEERTCTLCNGTGRVVVHGVKEIRIDAYEPNQDTQSGSQTTL